MTERIVTLEDYETALAAVYTARARWNRTLWTLKASVAGAIVLSAAILVLAVVAL